MRTLIRWRLVAGALSVLLGGALTLPASAYPNGPITFVVAYTPGSANDILVRIVAPGLGKNLEETIVVENKPGAGGSLGTSYVARATPNGQVLGLGSTATLAINPVLFKSIPYDTQKDFTGVAYLASTPNILVVPASSPAQSVDELVALMEDKTLNYSSPGNGTTQHLTGIMFVNQTGKSAEHVPFKGPAEAITSLAAGHVDFGFASLASALPQINAGRLKGLAVTTSEPVNELPDVPSISQYGFDGFDKTAVWFGIVVPKATPGDTVETLHAGTMKVLGDPDVRAQLVKAGYSPADPMPADAFQKLIDEQVIFWRDLVETSGASVD